MCAQLFFFLSSSLSSSLFAQTGSPVAGTGSPVAGTGSPVAGTGAQTGTPVA